MTTERITIKKMPDKETLEEFLEGMFGRSNGVSFNLRTGEFDRLGTKEDEKRPEYNHPEPE